MKPVKIILLATILFIANPNYIFSQNELNYKTIKLQLSFLDSQLVTGDSFIITGSEELKIEIPPDFIKLIKNEDYEFNYAKGIIFLSKDLFKKYSLDTLRIYTLVVIYDLYPYKLKEEYSNFEVITQKDTLTGDTITVATTSKDFLEDLFEGTDLEKSGSIFRGINFGSNRDISVNSGFRLQLKGKLSREIDITAALTDETTPIQPEGNTLKLQELDKVFIEVKSSNIAATLGDLEVNFPSSYEGGFINFNRKIQGVKGFGSYDLGNITFVGAISRGKFNTNSFNGIDGVQGPYRLTGKNNEINILVLSGTEKVYLDGVLLVRGEQADYVIDYALGQITFTNKKIITSASRIIVDFEYSDRKYSRALITGNSKIELLNKNLKINFSYLNETDNENKPIDFTLSDSDKVILKNAGADPPTKSGVVYVGKDSLGRSLGTYIKKIDSTGYVYYLYLPGDTAAVYNITFSYVGQGRGDYVNKSLLNYEFVGKNKGSYAPVIFLPVPTSYQLGDIVIEYNTGKEKELFFRLESAYSYFDKNKFSVLDDHTNGGVAFFGVLGYQKRNLDFLGIEINNLQISYKQRVINKLFYSLDRINDVEFNRNFDVQDSTQATEDWKEGNVNLTLGNLFSFKSNFANLKRGDFFNSFRTIASFEFNNPSVLVDTSGLPQFKYIFENVSSDFKPTNFEGNWFKHLASFSYRLMFRKERSSYSSLLFNITYNSEIKKNFIKYGNQDSLTFESFLFHDLTPKISLNNFLNLNLFAEFNYRKEDFPDNGYLKNFSNAYTQKFGLTYTGIDWFFTYFDIGIRNKKFSEIGYQKGNVDNNTVLLNSRTKFSPLSNALSIDLLYNITSERTAKIEKLFVLVPIGQGNYIYLGDLNANGVQDENEFQLVNYDGNYIKLNVPTGEYFPTIDLKTSARLYFKPSRYFYLNGVTFLNELYNNISAETFIKIDEKSKDPISENIYFLRFATFLNDSNTLSGIQLFQQDFNFFENNPQYSLRLRYLQQKGFNQYSSGNERLLNIQKSVKFRFGVTSDVSIQLEYVNKIDNNLAPINSVRNRKIKGDYFNTDFSYKPISEIESGLEINFSRATDYYPLEIGSTFTQADINQQILRFIYSFATVGRLRLEFERAEVSFNQSRLTFPYELTNGKTEGKSYFWRGYFDYSISKNIQASLNYDGRIEGGRKAIHTGRAQITAFF